MSKINFNFFKNCLLQMSKFMQKAVPLSSRLFSVPDKYKGGKIEKVANYLKNLYTDYAEASKDVLKGCRERPFKASIYATIGLSLLYLNQNRPNEQHFQDNFVRVFHDLSLVGDANRNKSSQSHCDRIMSNQNYGTLRFTNLGIATLVWEDNYDSSVGNFRSQCSYMQPTYLDILQTRIVDIGFNGRWRKFDEIMVDYDVNPDEWDNQGKPIYPDNQLKPMF